MDFEQIVKRLEWLDDEHRKDKAAISKYEERLASIELNIKTLREDIKDLSKKVADIGPVNQRISLFENSLSKQRADISESIDALEKKHQQREKDIVKRYQAGLEEINQSLPKLDQSQEISELRKLIKLRADEDIKLNIAVTELKPKIDDAVRKSEDTAISVNWLKIAAGRI
jgi:chromosome segregation ATPase